MQFAIRGLYDSAQVGLADYAFEKNATGEGVPSMSAQDFVDKAQAKQFRVGDVVKDDNNLYVYTGYLDPYTGMPFMTFALGK
jgi:hypothetical protein